MKRGEEKFINEGGNLPVVIMMNRSSAIMVGEGIGRVLSEAPAR